MRGMHTKIIRRLQQESYTVWVLDDSGNSVILLAARQYPDNVIRKLYVNSIGKVTYEVDYRAEESAAPAAA